MTDIKYRPDIDGLRAVAVIAVVLYHLGVPWLSGGFVGVDVFFVISGYLITKIIVRQQLAGTFKFRTFYASRARRIIPALLFLLTFVLVVGWWLLPPSDYASAGKASLATLAFASNIYFWRSGGYFDPELKLSPLLHTWSLGIEEQFYLGLPLLMVIAWRLGSRTLPWLLAAVVAISFVAAALLVHGYSKAVFFLPFFRLWELGAGSLLAVWSTARPTSRVARELQSAIGLGLIVVPCLAYDLTTPFPGAAALAPVMGAAMVVRAGESGESAVCRLLSTRAFVFYGAISYSLYLWHWPLIVFAGFGGPWAGGLVLSKVLLFVGSTAAAYVSYRFVETPFRRRNVHGPLPSLRPLVAVGTVCALAAFALVAQAGAPSRFSPAVQRLDGMRNPHIPFLECDSAIDRGLQSACVIGATDRAPDPTILFWGDSHLVAWAPAIDAALKDLGLSAMLIPNSACPPLADVSSVTRPRCADLSHRVVQLVETSEQIESVFLVSAWTQYFSDGGIHVLSDETGSSSNPEVAGRGLHSTVVRVRDAGKRVAIFGPVPRSDVDLPMALLLEEMNGASAPEATTVAEYRAANGPFFASVNALPLDQTVGFVDVGEWFCDPLRCPYMADGVLLFRDSHHLSVAGAMRFTDEISAAIRAMALGEPPIEGSDQ